MDPAVYARMAAHEDEHWWFVARRRILSDVIGRRIKPRAGCRILEAGCGTGGNLAMLSQFGKASAFEPEASARQLAAAKSGIEIREGALPHEVPFAPESFDIIAMLDVLEHVEDDAASLAALSQRLVRGGTLLLTVPAFPFLWSRHDEMHHHKRRYRRHQLIAAARSAGLQPTYVSYFNSLLFPAVVARRLAGQLMDDQHVTDDEMPRIGLNRLLQTIFAVERHILPCTSLPFGVSLLMTAQRR